MRKTLAVLLLAGCATGNFRPVTVLVESTVPVDQANADTLRRVTRDQLSNDVHTQRPLTVRIEIDSLGPANVPTSVNAVTGQATRANQQIPYSAAVAPADKPLVPLAAKYEILDGSGQLLESGNVPVTANPWNRSEAYQSIADYIAARVKAHTNS